MIITSGSQNNVTGTGVSNCSNVTVSTIGYIRVGAYVSISGLVSFETSEPGLCVARIPCPIPTESGDIDGCGGCFSDQNGNSGKVETDASGGMYFNIMNGTDNSFGEFGFSAMYKIVE